MAEITDERAFRTDVPCCEFWEKPKSPYKTRVASENANHVLIFIICVFYRLSSDFIFFFFLVAYTAKNALNKSIANKIKRHALNNCVK